MYYIYLKELKKMKIEKSYLNVDNKKLDTNILVYFDGNKEEVILEDNRVLIWCQEEDSYEKWLSLDVMDSMLLKKYLSNELTLLNLIENLNLSLYKRYYEKYDELVLDSKINLDVAIKMNLILPNDKAVLGYDFYSLYKNNRRLEDIFGQPEYIKNNQ